MNLFLNILEIASILVGACIIIICVISCIENRRLTVTEYRVRDFLIPEAFDAYHIVQISDLHNASYGQRNERLIGEVAKCKPDIILITGDVIIGKPDTDVLFAADTVNQLAKIAPVYFSMGNHELRVKEYPDIYSDMWQQFVSHLSPEIHLLLDREETIERDNAILRLYGLNLTTDLYRRWIRTSMSPDYLTALFGEADPNAYHIFMAHNPDYFDEYAAWGANLTFSGHVHGGMIRLPFFGGLVSPMISFFPKYDKGLFRIGQKIMILSGGLGNHTFKFRVNNLPEIISVFLYHERENE